MGNARQREGAKRKKQEHEQQQQQRRQQSTGLPEQAAAAADPEADAVQAKKQRQQQQADKQRQVDAEPAEEVDNNKKKNNTTTTSNNTSNNSNNTTNHNNSSDACESGSWNVGQGPDGSKGKGKRKEKEFEVCVNGLPFSATEDLVWKDFSECGEIADFYCPMNEDGSLRGMAFIAYSDQESVDKALAFHDSEYGGRWIQVRLSSDKTKGKGKGIDAKGTMSGKGNKEFEVFIGGLTHSTTEVSLRQDFEECGKIVYCRVPVNDEGSARGIAFLQFADRESVDKALEFHDTEPVYPGEIVERWQQREGQGFSARGAALRYTR
ncbi:unnamed protein product, partial [Polarella glacialis]